MQTKKVLKILGELILFSGIFFTSCKKSEAPLPKVFQLQKGVKKEISGSQVSLSPLTVSMSVTNSARWKPRLSRAPLSVNLTSSMTRNQIKIIFYRILEDHGNGGDVSVVPESATLREDLGGDELEIMEIILAVENEFNIEIPDYDAETLLTVGDFINYIENAISLSGGGGGSSPPPDPSVECPDEYANVSGEAASESLPGVTLEETAATRKASYKWKYWKSYFWYYVSEEKGTHKKVGGRWQWDSLIHDTAYISGSVIGGTLEMLVRSATPTVGIYHAGMELNFYLTGHGICKGSPFTVSISNKTQNSPIWNSEEWPVY